MASHPLSDPKLLRRLPAAVGTPFYLYDADVLRGRVRAVLELTRGEGLQARFAMKACPAHLVLKEILRAGIWIDAVSGNEVLRDVLKQMDAEALEGTMYSHPIGDHGHAAGPLIGLWDYQDGVPGRGDVPVLASMWFSTELQVTSPVAEWNNQKVRMALEEEAEVSADGVMSWTLRRQSELHLVR